MLYEINMKITIKQILLKNQCIFGILLCIACLNTKKGVKKNYD